MDGSASGWVWGDVPEARDSWKFFGISAKNRSEGVILFPLGLFAQLTGTRWLRVVARGSATGLAIGYLLAGLLLYFEQGDLLFPAPKSYEKDTPATVHLPFEDLHIAVSPSEYLHAWWIPAAAPSAKVILMFHGNGYVLENIATSEAVVLHEIGTNLLLVDYRGYGGSSPAKTRESTVYEDARSALSYLTEHRRVSVHDIYVLGRSIGSGPATQSALENPRLGGLILESPFSSIDDAARVLPVTRMFPVHWMLRTHFDNLSKIGSVRVPLLMVSGSADSLTPVWMAKAIFAQANQPKQLMVIPGAGHDDLLFVGGQALTDALRNFVNH